MFFFSLLVIISGFLPSIFSESVSQSTPFIRQRLRAMALPNQNQYHYPSRQRYMYQNGVSMADTNSPFGGEASDSQFQPSIGRWTLSPDSLIRGRSFIRPMISYTPMESRPQSPNTEHRSSLPTPNYQYRYMMYPAPRWSLSQFFNNHFWWGPVPVPQENVVSDINVLPVPVHSGAPLPIKSQLLPEIPKPATLNTSSPIISPDLTTTTTTTANPLIVAVKTTSDHKAPEEITSIKLSEDKVQDQVNTAITEVKTAEKVAADVIKETIKEIVTEAEKS